MHTPDDESFAAFAVGVQHQLHHLAWLLTGDVHRAEELVQETLVRAYTAWHRIDPEDPFRYVQRILVNAKTDGWRRRRREQLVGNLPEPTTCMPDVANAVEAHSTVVAALRTLAPRERAVVVLRYYMDLSEADTAAQLGVSEGTVKSAASRALAKMRKARAAGEDCLDASPYDATGVTGGRTRG